MSASPLRPFVPPRFDRPGVLRAVEVLLDEISALVATRQALRGAGAVAAQLEQNRLQIVRAQWELSYSLIHRYRPAAKAA